MISKSTTKGEVLEKASGSRSDVSSSSASSLLLLSIEQLTDVRDTLKGIPLKNRDVLIPFGRKAFIHGHLYPLQLQEVIEQDNTTATAAVAADIVVIPNASEKSADDIAKEQEYVIVHNVIPDFVKITGGEEAEIEGDNMKRTVTRKEHVVMTRQQALDYLQNEIDSMKPKRSSTKPTSSLTTRKATAVPSKTSSEQTIESLPYVEIREELDESGNAIKEEVVNVSQQIQYLKQQQQQQDNPRDSTHNIVPNDTVDSKEEIDATSINDDNDNDDDDENEIIQQSQSTSVSDEQYNAIAKRLEELILLEERANNHNDTSVTQTQQRITKTTPKSKSNNGWSKGFLNKSNTTSRTKKTIISIPTLETNNVQNSNNTAAKVLPQDTSASPSLSSNTNVNKKVSFTNNDNIQIIPRIGHQSISSTSTTTTSSAIPSLTIPKTSKETKSFDTNVVASYVLEKQGNSNRRRSRTNQIIKNASTMNNDTKFANGNDSDTTTAATTKKVSRFLQERHSLNS